MSRLRFGDLIKGARKTKEIKWPGGDLPMLMRILTVAEKEEAAISAFKRLDGQGIPPERLGDLHMSVRAYETMFRALLDPQNSTERMFPSIDSLREFATVEDLEALSDEYAAFTAECDPSFADMPEAELSELIEELKKKPEAISNLSGTHFLRSLLRFTVNQLLTLQNPSS